jgi:DNA-binding NtrC family response regulator
VLIISDLRMPELNGIEFIKKLKDLNPLVRTILMTTFAVIEDYFKHMLNRKEKMHFFRSPYTWKNCVEVNNQLQSCDLLKQKSLIKMP